MSGNSSSSSSLMRTKNKRTPTVSTMPITPQTIHAGKNDPRILNEGAREHPAANSVGANDAPTTAASFMRRPSGDGEFPVNFSNHLPAIFGAAIFGGIGLRPFRVQQVARLES